MSHSVAYTVVPTLPHDTLLPQGPCVQLRMYLLWLHSGSFPTCPSLFFPFRRSYSGGGHSSQMSGTRASQASYSFPSLEQKSWLQVPISHFTPPSPDKEQEILSHLPWRWLSQPWEQSYSLDRGSAVVGKLQSQPQLPLLWVVF